LQPRKLDESEIMNEAPVVREVWLYLLRKVSHKNHGNLKRGQGFFRLTDIQNNLCWYVGYRKMRYSKPQLTKSLRRLRERNMIATMKATRGVFVTVLNYDYYQDPNNYEGNDENPTKETRRKRSGITINKNGNKNERSISCSSNDERLPGDDKFFTEFWTDYPRKTGKGAARKAWKKIKSPKATLEKILAALEWQKKSEQWTKDGGQYIPYPGTYLNQERWEDEPEGESSTEAKHITCPHCSQYMAIFEIKNNKCPACGGRIDL
jgi:hypothetical protein